MQAIQNLGLAVVPIIAGHIVDNNGYLMLEVFFLAMLCIALIAGIYLHCTLFKPRYSSTLLVGMHDKSMCISSTVSRTIIL